MYFCGGATGQYKAGSDRTNNSSGLVGIGNLARASGLVVANRRHVDGAGINIVVNNHACVKTHDADDLPHNFDLAESPPESSIPTDTEELPRN